MSAVRNAVAASVALAATRAYAQTRPDTVRTIEPVVVTAARTDAPLAASTAAVTRLTSADLKKLPARTVADALGFVPGFAVIQGDGIGLAPRLVVRGFYGGAETEYVSVLVDGVPVSQLATGQVNWDLIPLQAVESIEVVRGGASSLYGDAAVGGVVNLITRRDQPFARWRLAGGDYDSAEGGGALGGTLGGHRASLFADARTTQGYRVHEKRTAASGGASIALAQSDDHTLTLSALSHVRKFDDPGPLTGTTVVSDRRFSSPFYQFDETHDQLHRVSLDGSSRLAPGTRLSGYLTGEYGRTNGIRTLPLSAAFADTKERRTHSGRAVGSLQLSNTATLAGMPSTLVLGTDLSAGRLASEYSKVLTGTEAQYRTAAGTVGALDSKGTGTRETAAAFASWELRPVDPLRLSLGGRVDWMNDTYRPEAPSTGSDTSASRTAFSPHAGANVRWLETDRQRGNVYVTAGRSFKAPTMDQLFDQRKIPTQTPPFGITISNPKLVPQYGTSVEGGAYHDVSLVPGRVSARASLSAYQTDMKNELDFDIKTFRYVNIGRSRHRGVEAGLTLDAPMGHSVFATYTLQHATSRGGEDDGKLLKAIPENVLTAGVARSAATGLSGTLSATVVGRTFLDDANALVLPRHTQVDAKLAYPVLRARVTLDVRNLLGREYSTTGFPDPGGGKTTFYYPAAKRVILVGLEAGR